MKILSLLAEVTDLKSAIDDVPLPKNTSFDVQTVLNWIYGIMGMAAVIFIIYSAVGYLSSQGDPGKIKKSSQSIAFAIVGLAIILMVAAITNFIFSTIGGA